MRCQSRGYYKGEKSERASGGVVWYIGVGVSDAKLAGAMGQQGFALPFQWRHRFSFVWTSRTTVLSSTAHGGCVVSCCISYKVHTSMASLGSRTAFVPAPSLDEPFIFLTFNTQAHVLSVLLRA